MILEESAEMLPTIRDVFSNCEALDRKGALRAVATAIGVQRLSMKQRKLVGQGLRLASLRGILAKSDNAYVLSALSIEKYSQVEAIHALRVAMGPALMTRDEAITAATRYWGFQRTGSRIRAKFTSAINGGIRRGLIRADGTEWIQRVPSERVQHDLPNQGAPKFPSFSEFFVQEVLPLPEYGGVRQAIPSAWAPCTDSRTPRTLRIRRAACLPNPQLYRPLWNEIGLGRRSRKNVQIFTSGIRIRPVGK
ncbi:MAG TPA: hypothetical protein VM165_11750 [Planctomycetaceae bacterium]|nr:hypothetical protein [Planctomycetaceae bacterium]